MPNREDKPPQGKVAKLRSGNCFSMFFYTFMLKVYKIGNKRPFTEADFFKIDDRYTYRRNLDDLLVFYRKHKDQHSLFWIVFFWAFPIAILQYIFSFYGDIIGLAMPFVLRAIIQWLEAYVVSPGSAEIWKIIVFCCIIIFAVFSRAILYNYGNHRSFDASSLHQNSIFGLIYQKMKTVDIRALSYINAGELTNNLTNDLHRVYVSLITFRQIPNTPVTLVVICVILNVYYGSTMLAGIGIVLLSLGCMVILSKILSKLAIEKLTVNDMRNSETNFAVNGIKSVKFNSWEWIISDRILTLRKREKKLLFWIHFFRSFSDIIIFAMPSLAGMTSILLYTAAHNDTKMGLADAFFILTIFNLLVGPIRLFYFSLSSLFEAIKSFNRIEFMLKLPDSEDSKVESDGTSETLKLDSEQQLLNQNDFQTIQESKQIQENCFVKFENASFVYKNQKFEDSILSTLESLRGKKSEKYQTIIATQKQPQNNFTLKNLNFEARPGEITMIIGSIGSGKTSILKAILKNLFTTHGKFSSKGRIAYIPQKSVLINDRLRENILFGAPYEAGKYNLSLDISQLRPDLDILVGGEFAEIGENGLNLSGGQKQRVSIARAYYADSDIYLIDDALSALDYHVGQKIFDEMIMQSLLKQNKTVIMATHLLQFLEHAHHVIFMEEGQIVCQGTLEELKQSNQRFNKFIMNKDKPTKLPPLDKIEKSKFEYNTKIYDERLNYDSVSSAMVDLQSYRSLKEIQVKSRKNIIKPSGFAEKVDTDGNQSRNSLTYCTEHLF